MIVKIISASGKTISTFYFSRNRRSSINEYLQNLYEHDNNKNYKKCLVTLNGLSWKFDQKFFEAIWVYLYEAFQLQSKVNELKKNIESRIKQK